jgi:GNAT superfamily N-acetyltransferase
MREGMMNLTFEKATSKDARTLAKICERAFHSDAAHGAPGATGGPPGYNSDRFQMRMMIAAEYYKMVLDGKIVGGILFRLVAYQHCEVIRIFVDPKVQRQGIGVQAMAFMENLHPDVKRWTLGTPQWNTRTPRFYEKCGYVQVGTDDHGDYLFEKQNNMTHDS